MALLNDVYVKNAVGWLVGWLVWGTRVLVSGRLVTIHVWPCVQSILSRLHEGIQAETKRLVSHLVH